MNFKRCNLLALMLLLAMPVMAASYIGSEETYISSVISYNQFGAGDVVFRLDKPIQQCHGYWINKGDPGFEANLSMIIAAYQAKSPVMIYGLPAQSEKWKGSRNHWCKLYQITYR
ncbi:hypothetical protein [Vibrio aestuarianus]|uniref:Uncharacterized protein n=1 Tax=Vibrio aestuarianus TaxID=28171 RepID=A0A9X4EW99_9VIBR|nr:hypothetical protein [Vibrio aestuarianus]MDE1243547.1 hypothetical protein [Vibrio aestuarianus]